MKSKQKQLCTQLLKGNYLMRRPNGNMEAGYGIYSGNKIIHGWVPTAIVSSIFPLLKEDNKHRYTLNLQSIRQMDGRTWLKKKYKSIKAQNVHP